MEEAAEGFLPCINKGDDTTINFEGERSQHSRKASPQGFDGVPSD
jgi:hypothetical protein